MPRAMQRQGATSRGAIRRCSRARQRSQDAVRANAVSAAIVRRVHGAADAVVVAAPTAKAVIARARARIQARISRKTRA